MITIFALQQIENQLAKRQDRKACEIRAGVFPKTFMEIFAMFNRLENEIIFNKEIVYDAPEHEVVITLIHESRHAYQWDRISHPRKAIESKELIEKWKKEPKFKTRFHNRCQLCGRPRGYLRQFGLCRLCFRALAHKGGLPGVRKASW